MLMAERVVFFKGTPESSPLPPLLPFGYQSLIWRPSLLRLRPPGCAVYPFFMWWLFHVLGIFRNHQYKVFLIRRDSEWIHRSVVTPGFFRFPFMSFHDLQVGDVWTAEYQRNLGLASFALLSLLQADGDRQRPYWYLVSELNTASARIAERANFRRIAFGLRTSYCGIRLFGKYQIQEQSHGRQEAASN
jgi:hypothetical protein